MRVPRRSRVTVKDPVRIQKIGPIGVQMPGVRRQVDGRADLIADEMDGVEVLREPDEVAVIPVIPRTPPALAIVNVGWARNQAEIDVVSADDHALGGIARA